MHHRIFPDFFDDKHNTKVAPSYKDLTAYQKVAGWSNAVLRGLSNPDNFFTNPKFNFKWKTLQYSIIIADMTVCLILHNFLSAT